MNSDRARQTAWITLAAVCAACGLAAGAGSAPRPADPEALRAAADTRFTAGEFAAADSLYARVLAASPRDTLALRRRGALALLANRTGEARRWLASLLERDPANRVARSLMAESYVREDDFAHAAPLDRALGRESRARQLESFAGRKPYRIEGGTTEVAFAQTDPLPVIQVRVNGREPAYFIIDTGAAELVLDPEFADSVGARTFGADSGTFAGGKRAAFTYGAVDSVRLGGATVRDVPVSILSTRRFAGVSGGRRVDGIVGTSFLYHFLPTLDYPGGRLVLEPRTRESLDRLERTSRDSATIVPFWMGGDHFMVAPGRMNRSGPVLWFVDTGLAGAGFTCPETTLREAGIDLTNAPSFDGTGGGGKVAVKPFAADSLWLGPLMRRGITGFFGAFPGSLEYGQGFRIAGLISHGFLRAYRLTLDFTGMRYFVRGVG